MAELIPIRVTLEVTELHRHIIAIDLDDYERDIGTRELSSERLVEFLKLTPNWGDRFDGTDVLELDIVEAEGLPITAGEPPR